MDSGETFLESINFCSRTNPQALTGLNKTCSLKKNISSSEVLASREVKTLYKT